MNQNLMNDPILDEIHQTRREMSDKFGGDFTAMLDDARQRQAASGRPIWTPKSPGNSNDFPQNHPVHAVSSKTHP